MWKSIKQFFSDQNGAVMVDWVVLCGVLLALGTTTYASMENSVDALTTEFSTKMSNTDVN